MEAIEKIILRHPQRGMDMLAPYMSPGYCREAAEMIYTLGRGNVLLLTGFYVHGWAETDGPAGTWVIANALRALGFTPVIVTDRYLKNVFEPYGFPVEYYPLRGTDEDADSILSRYEPVLLLSLERCGRTEEGDYINMHGVSVRSHTAPADTLFLRAYGRIPTVGIGDGGNEIGMGNHHDFIKSHLSCAPSAVKADKLIIATVSNWGGYGLCAYLSRMSGLDLLPSFPEQQQFMAGARKAAGCIDGVYFGATLTEDGYPSSYTAEILAALKNEIAKKPDR